MGEWLESVPEEFRADPNFQTLKLNDGEALVPVPPSLLKGYVHAQKLIGRDKIPLPKDDSPPEEWNSVWKALGRPDDPEAYEFTKPDTAKDLPIPPELEKGFKKFAHEQGLTKKQAGALYGWYLQNAAEAQGQLRTQHTQSMERVREELARDWGENWEQRVQWLDGLVVKYWGDEGVEAIRASGLGNDPRFIRGLAKFSDQYAEARRIGTERPNEILTKDRALEEIEKINKDTKHPYWNEGEGHKEAVEEMKRLSAIAYGK